MALSLAGCQCPTSPEVIDCQALTIFILGLGSLCILLSEIIDNHALDVLSRSVVSFAFCNIVLYHDCFGRLCLHIEQRIHTCYRLILPKAMGIELMLLGGISPTSVTTAVMEDGGVRS